MEKDITIVIGHGAGCNETGYSSLSRIEYSDANGNGSTIPHSRLVVVPEDSASILDNDLRLPYSQMTTGDGEVSAEVMVMLAV